MTGVEHRAEGAEDQEAEAVEFEDGPPPVGAFKTGEGQDDEQDGGDDEEDPDGREQEENAQWWHGIGQGWAAAGSFEGAAFRRIVFF